MEESLRSAVDGEFAPKAVKEPKSSGALAKDLAAMEHELARARVLIATAEVEIEKKRAELHEAIERERQEEVEMHTNRLAELEALRPTNGGGLPDENDSRKNDDRSGTSVAIIPDPGRNNGASRADAGLPVDGAGAQGS